MTEQSLALPVQAAAETNRYTLWNALPWRLLPSCPLTREDLSSLSPRYKMLLLLLLLKPLMWVTVNQIPPSSVVRGHRRRLHSTLHTPHWLPARSGGLAGSLFFAVTAVDIGYEKGAFVSGWA